MAAAKIKAIEGLRAFAIISVLFYHLSVSWLPSGHMGVVVFLVLTGYLVTNSVLREFDRTGEVKLLSFWGRRFKRLWPPMAVMILLVAVLCVLFNHYVLTKMRPDILPSLLFFDNWNYILSGLSYFDKIGAPSPLTHLWYLGVDAQLCILWPLLLMLGLKVTDGKKNVLAIGTGALALISAVLMAVLFVPGSDPSRVYYGCDTRAFSVLIGALLAFAWPLGYMPVVGRKYLTSVVGERRVMDRYSAEGVSVRPVYGPSKIAEYLGIGALVLLVLVMVFIPADAWFFYYGGMVLVSLLSVALMMTLVSPGTKLAQVFSCAPLQWLGSRSFALYLWHYPIIVLLGADAASAPWWLKLIAIVLSLGAAELSWRLTEQPFSNKELMARIKDEGVRFFTRMPNVAGTGAAAVCLLVALVGCLVVPETTLVPKDAITSTGESVDHATDLSALRAESRAEGSSADAQTASTDAQSTPAQESASAQQLASIQASELPAEVMSFALHQSGQDNSLGHVSPLLIGDSVPPEIGFYSVFPDGYEDTYVGRMPKQGFSVLNDYVTQGVVGAVVVLACFSNSTPQPEDLDAMVASSPWYTNIYLVGTVNPDGFQDDANQNLIECAERHENVHYIDWPAVCEGHEEEYLWADKTHLRPEGERVYLDMIARAIAGDVIASGGTVSLL